MDQQLGGPGFGSQALTWQFMTIFNSSFRKLKSIDFENGPTVGYR